MLRNSRKKTKVQSENADINTINTTKGMYMQLCIKLIEVEGSYKALVLDMSRKGNRIEFIATNADKNQAWDEAQSFIDSLPQDETDSSVFH